jgi:hypothetical protein
MQTQLKRKMMLSTLKHSPTMGVKTRNGKVAVTSVQYNALGSSVPLKRKKLYSIILFRSRKKCRSPLRTALPIRQK